jgi:hypothetical protein
MKYKTPSSKHHHQNTIIKTPSSKHHHQNTIIKIKSSTTSTTYIKNTSSK